jgi:RNA polymerase sigma-70 factor (ECF subfamily)
MERDPDREATPPTADPRSGELREWLAFRGAVDERAALQHLFDEHRAALIAYVFRRTGDADLTQDVVSETFLRAARARGTLEWRGVPLRGWLVRIATNELRAAARAPRHIRAADELEARSGASSSSLDHEALRLALASLPDEMQEAITLHHLQDVPVIEVARLLGAPEGTVKSWLWRGRALLRERLRVTHLEEES